MGAGPTVGHQLLAIDSGGIWSAHQVAMGWGLV